MNCSVDIELYKSPQRNLRSGFDERTSVPAEEEEVLKEKLSLRCDIIKESLLFVSGPCDLIKFEKESMEMEEGERKENEEMAKGSSMTLSNTPSTSSASSSTSTSNSFYKKRRHRHEALFDNLDKTLHSALLGKQQHLPEDASMCFAAMALVFTANTPNTHQPRDASLPEDIAIHRPFVPLPVVRMLWSFLLQHRRSSYSLPDHLHLIQDALLTSLSFLDKTALPHDDDVNHDLGGDQDDLPVANIVDAVPSLGIVASANVDIDFHLEGNMERHHDIDDEEQDEGVCLRINHDIHHLYGIYIAKTRPQLFSQHTNTNDSTAWDPEKELNNDMVQACLNAIQTHDQNILHSNDHSDNDDTYNNDTNNTQNETSDDSCSQHLDDPYSIHGSCQYDYAVEMLPWHMMRCARYKDAALLLCTTTFVKRRFTTLGVYEGTKMHVADVEELQARLLTRDQHQHQHQQQESQISHHKTTPLNVLTLRQSFTDNSSFISQVDKVPSDTHDTIQEQQQQKEEPYIDIQDLFLSCYKSLQTVLKTQDQIVPLITANNTLSNAYSISDHSSEDNNNNIQNNNHNHHHNTTSLIANNSALLLQSTVEIAKSYHCLGSSLSTQNLTTDAMKYYSRSLVQIEKSHAALCQNPHSASYLSSISSAAPAEEDCSIDTVQYLMAETLFAMATLHDSTKKYTEAMLFYERALAFYSRQRQLRHRIGVAKTLANMGIVHFHIKEMTSAESCFEESLELWRGLQQTSESDGSRNAVSSNASIADKSFSSAAAAAASSNNVSSDLVPSSSVNNSNNHHHLSTTKTSSSSTPAAAGTTASIGDEEISDLLQWMANVRRETHQYDEAMSHLREALYVKILSVGRNHPEVALIHHSMGVVHDDLAQFDKSIKCYEEAMRIRKMVLCEVRGRWRSIKRSSLKNKEHLQQQQQQQQAFMSNDYDDICDYSYLFCGQAEEEEMAVAETLRCMGNVSVAQEKKWDAYCRLWECAMIHRSRVGYYLGQALATEDNDADVDKNVTALTNAAATAPSSFVFFSSRELANLITVDLDAEEEEGGEHSSPSFAMQHTVEDALENLKVAIELSRYFLPGGSERTSDEHFLVDLMGQVADMLYDRGIIHGSRYICLSEGKNGFGDAEEERKLAVKDLSESVSFRKTRISIISSWGAGQKADEEKQGGEEGCAVAATTTLDGKVVQDDAVHCATEDDEILIAFTYYEMGKLYCTTAQRAMKRNRSQEGLADLVKNKKKYDKAALKKCSQAVKYFEEARSIMWKNLDLIHPIETERDHQEQSYDTSNVVDNEGEVCSEGGEDLPFSANEEGWGDIRNPVYVRLQQIPSALEDMLGTMGILYTHLKKYEKAVECYNKVSIILSRVGFGGDHGDNSSACSNDSTTRKIQHQKERVALSIHSIGDILFETGDSERALQSYKEALQLRRSIRDKTKHVAETLFALGDVHLERREFDDALIRYNEALEIRIALQGQNHPNVAFCHHHIGKAHEGLGDYEKALKSYQSAMDVVRVTNGNGVIVSEEDTRWHAVVKLDAIDIADICFDVGRVLLLLQRGSDTIEGATLKKDQYELVLTCLSQALEKYQEHFDDDCVEVANTSCLMGEAYDRTGQYEKAIACLEKALQIYQGRRDKMRIASTYNAIGMAHLKHQEIMEDVEDDKSLECFDKAIDILKENGKEGKEVFAEYLMNKGLALDKIDDVDLALKSLRESYCHYSNNVGEEHLKVSVVLSKLGSSLIKDRNHGEAMTQLQEALRIRKLNSSDQDEITAEILFGLGIIHCENRDYNEAINSYEEAMKIRRKTLGEEHIEVAHILLNVGSVFARNGEYERALVPWRHAIDMYKAAGLQDDHPKVKCALGNIEIARNLASIAKNKEVETSVRKLENY